MPGPRIQITEGDRVRIKVSNNLPESTSVHWHGLVVPNSMNGPAELTQPPTQPGSSFAYAFRVNHAGTFFYHSHDHPDREQALGEYGALIVAPASPSIDPAYAYQYDVPIPIAGVAGAGGLDVPSDAHGRSAAELLHDVIWEARLPGKWLLHCHIRHHTTNDNREEQGGGGLTMVIDMRL